ncbi:sugar-phosphatase [Streptococcus pseudoporcinus]|uniref:Haloacid dehalogenase n=1 Tax=Streptococcus pseudoporcinus TaxID=361101 RepID=A0A4U9XJY9_9STRE|nr:sugar-phosphatase [Streptococcus pseudoporcinus]VTS13105.1 haloacid dehalogenase [Streptococcus pseudoporcinus]VUC66294.1 haloacid dehalogenase [Streptococcus pseudoporcinus]VUC97222.1 haloacid dehalogenase [Streptococcus pseudoporcinus]VUC97610.1 haloacid dehalogenase [Streptococcus pseudoporcinus]
MSIKLVALDIDGTLLTDDRKITSQVFEAVQDAKAQGVQVVIATGRPIAGVTHLLNELNLNHQGNYVITFNGGLVQDAETGQEIVKSTMSYEDYLEIEFLSRKIGLHMHAITKEGIYTANRDIGKYTVHEARLVNMPIFYRTPEEMASKEIVKMMMIDEPDILDEAIKNIPPSFYDNYNIVKSTPFYLEFMLKSVSKGNAIIHLAEKMGLNQSQTMAIGDAENDRAMLEVVGNPVVMENGSPELKMIAKYITKSNNESGVAHALREWVLK